MASLRQAGHPIHDMLVPGSLGDMDGSSANRASSALGAPELVSRQAGRGRAGEQMSERMHCSGAE